MITRFIRAFAWTCFVYAVFVLWLLALGTGCGGIPQTIRLDDRFSAVEIATITDARDQWCEKAAYCPELVMAGGEARILLQDTDVPAVSKKVVGGHTNQHQRKIMLSDGVMDAEPELLWVMVAHELGHLQGIDHHGTADCTMFWLQTTPKYDLTCED